MKTKWLKVDEAIAWLNDVRPAGAPAFAEHDVTRLIAGGRITVYFEFKGMVGIYKPTAPMWEDDDKRIRGKNEGYFYFHGIVANVGDADLRPVQTKTIHGPESMQAFRSYQFELIDTYARNDLDLSYVRMDGDTESVKNASQVNPGNVLRPLQLSDGNVSLDEVLLAPDQIAECFGLISSLPQIEESPADAGSGGGAAKVDTGGAAVADGDIKGKTAILDGGAWPKAEWVQEAWKVGTEWMLAEEEKRKERPGIVEIAKHVEGEFKRRDIRSKRLDDYLDWETIKKEITGITERNKGDNFKSTMGNPQRKKHPPTVKHQ